MSRRNPRAAEDAAALFAAVVLGAVVIVGIWVLSFIVGWGFSMGAGL